MEERASSCDRRPSSFSPFRHPPFSITMSATMLRTSSVRPAQLSRAAPRRCAARTAVVTRAANIVETAVSTGKHKTLVAAVTAAGLAETLSGGNFTLFAPTDEAFAKLPAGTLESLLKPENKAQLADILLVRHAVYAAPQRTAIGGIYRIGACVRSRPPGRAPHPPGAWQVLRSPYGAAKERPGLPAALDPRSWCNCCFWGSASLTLRTLSCSAVLTRARPPQFHVVKGKSLSKHVANAPR